MDAATEIMNMRSQGLTDNLISEELKSKGMSEGEIHQALGGEMPAMSAPMHEAPAHHMGSPMPSSAQGNIYERVEEIVEGMIDEKWDDLVAEVRKVIDWKQKVEQQQHKVEQDLLKLKEDFKTLHQGVLGKLDNYDQRMGEVGAELQAVGSVFKDVVPQFVENVKELSSITKEFKK
jgi:hypothetical protein